MSIARRLISLTHQFGCTCAQSAGVFVRDVGRGMLEVSHNTLALLGLITVALVVFLASREDLRHSLELNALSWLQARHEVPLDPLEAMAEELKEPDAISRATAVDPKDLNRQQAAVAQWLSRRYRVAPEPVSRLVMVAWSVGAKVGLDPTLILAVMAIESNFNPFAQSPVGAQGLMQVMTRIHDHKYQAFGGTLAAFDPVANLRVGVQVLKECISRAGDIEAGLRLYVGAGNLPSDDGYSVKVLNERAHLLDVAAGKTVAFNAPNAAAAPSPAQRASPEPAAEPQAVPDGEDSLSSEKVASLP